MELANKIIVGLNWACFLLWITLTIPMTIRSYRRSARRCLRCAQAEPFFCTDCFCKAAYKKTNEIYATGDHKWHCEGCGAAENPYLTFCERHRECGP